MITVETVSFSIPKESPRQIAEKVERALDTYEGRDDVAVRFVFDVSASACLMRPWRLVQLKNAVEPYRSRVRMTCCLNEVVVPNPGVGLASRAAVAFFKPDVPTRVRVRKRRED